MIGGETDLSAQNKEITAELMLPMPLDNYRDKPREAIEPWCSFYESLPSESKNAFMARLWNALDDKEQTAVIMDLRLFTAQALNAKKEQELAAVRNNCGGGASASSSEDDAWNCN
jgi:hypothetical protein